MPPPPGASEAPASPAFPPYPTQQPPRACVSPPPRPAPAPATLSVPGPSTPTRTGGPGPPSGCGLGLLPARQLVPPRPYGAHAHDTATRCPLGTELLPAATLRPSPLLLPLHRRVSVRQRRRREHGTTRRMPRRGALPKSRPAGVRATTFCCFSEQGLLTTQIGGWTGRAGAGGGSWAGGKGRRTAETLRLREASRTGRRPWQEGNGNGSCAVEPHAPPHSIPPSFLTW